jgi:hypothetical protein
MEYSSQYPFRFKTEQEFIDEYGIEFRNRSILYSSILHKFINVHAVWVLSMDYLFGKPYPFIIQNMNDDNLPKLSSGNGYFFTIKSYMLTKNETIPTYKPKKLIYE